MRQFSNNIVYCNLIYQDCSIPHNKQFLKLEDPTIDVRFTSEGLILNNVDSFLGFNSEGEIISLLDELVSKQLINKKEKGGVVL